MEDIAQAADVSTSTLYRYFPSKELLAIAPLGEAGVMARAFADRYAAHGDLAEALGHALLELLRAAAESTRDSSLLDGLVASHPSVQQRLWEWFGTEHNLLAQQVGIAIGQDASSVEVTTRTWMTVYVLWRAKETVAVPGEVRSLAQVAHELLEELAGRAVLPPCIPRP